MNMNPEYRRELKQLDRAETKVRVDHLKFAALLDKGHLTLERKALASQKRVHAEIERIKRRRALLEGRLA